MVSNRKLQELAALAVETKDFRPLAEAYNENALELVADVLAKHTATMLEALHSLASPSAGAVVPEGWKLVPVEPTPEMRSAFQSDEPPLYFARTTVFIGDFGERYAEMLAAAPEVPRG